MSFHTFASMIHGRYNELAKGELYVVDVNPDDLWAHYLQSFPEGSNPIYRVNTEHDCSCCRHFIKNLGPVVGIVDGKVQTIWDFAAKNLYGPYQVVANSMHDYIVSRPLKTIFRSKERSYGVEKNHETTFDGPVITYYHFHGKVHERHYSATPDAARGEFNAALQVFTRGLKELAPEALQTVLDLIDSKALYRGEEHRAAVAAFQALQKHYNDVLLISDEWRFANAMTPYSRFRNTVIGTLVQDLSDGVELEQAVRSFEVKVAPTNYKRTTALITPKMIEQAMDKVAELGLRDALERRHAVIYDTSVNNVLWVCGSSRPKMKDGLVESLMGSVKPAKEPKGTDIGIEEFMSSVLPTAESMQLFVKNSHLGNFVTITAPVHADAGRLFKWDNGFAWSYDGNVTDSIREKVKKAGGNVDAKLRFSLAWFNHDDLDFHCQPPGLREIAYFDKQGILDVDMNAGTGRTREPVENLAFKTPRDGRYTVWVHQFSRRETTDVGFTVQIADATGAVQEYSYDHAVAGDVMVGEFLVDAGRIVEAKLNPKLKGGGVAQEKWGVKTESLVPVRTVMLSPNHWDGQRVGNKHWFFLLEGCRADEPMRGIYNEFLRSELEQHRKVFEILGSKTKCPVTDDQLSGLGFSSTRGDVVTIAVKSSAGTRQYNVTF